MKLFQAAKQVDCSEVMLRSGQAGRLTAGERGKWVCPFHDHHEPSLVTYPREAGKPSHFYCFSCGAHGDAVDLYAGIERITPLDAARKLCKEWGLLCEDRGEPHRSPPMQPEEDPRLGGVLTVCREWKTYRKEWYREQQRLYEARLAKPHCQGWMHDMDMLWLDYYSTQVAKYERMTEWEVLQDIREELESLGVSPYRRIRLAGIVS